ncbi:ATP-binding protein [Alsobacter sp. SYSU M60028]|uniref:histidine kinase n=1 Tax=Alsobacter ponti TaxID=2962936 RepID=A0ABT1LEZ6_9HYPH|nr:ATP-binding protein [Alsobacter ponti]MCP8940060.1 ATP-binding protein [Alsobacter ponti]
MDPSAPLGAPSGSPASDRTAFLAMMSHEIRTPLNGIVGIAEAMQDFPLAPEHRRYVDALRGSADHLLRVVDDVLAFSKLEAGRVEPADAEFDLAALLHEVAEMAAPAAHAKGLFLGAFASPDLPAMVRGDADLLRQVLVNLVGNGVKFTARGHVLLEARRKADGEDGEPRLEILVRDTGIGIPAEALPRLFGEFVQVDSSIARRFGGTGLGLAISRRIARLLGGVIDVSSRPDVGSTFRVELPLRAARGRAPLSRALAGRRLLVVAANAGAREFHARCLAALGADFRVASDAASATAALAEASVDAVLVDETLGDEGVEALAAGLRRRAAGARLVLAAAAPACGEPGAARGFDLVLAKPTTPAATAAALAAAADSPPPRPGSAPRGLVLLAEDVPTNRMVLAAQLERLGFAHVAVADGEAAVRAAAAQRFDAVLMDLMMPGMDGYAAARAIRALPAPNCDVPIVALTASTLAADAEAARAAGVDAVAAKPLSREALQRVLATPRAGADPAPGGPGDAPLAALRDAMDAAELDELVEVFVTDTAARIAAMRDGLGDPRRIGLLAHAIRSAATAMGLAGLAAIAEGLERDAAGLDVEALERQVTALDAAFGEARAALEGC